MKESDFEAIIKKYKSLINSQGPFEPKEPSEKSDEATNPNFFSQELRSEHSEDAFIESDRFIREPLRKEAQEEIPESVYRHLLFSNLLDGLDSDFVGKDSLDFESPAGHGKGRDFDYKSIEYARNLYHSDMDLREHYNPELGMFPGQALYVPRHRRHHQTDESS